MNKLLKNFIAVILILVVISGIFALFSSQDLQDKKEIPFSQFTREIQQGNVEKIKVKGEEITITYKSGEKALTTKEGGVSIFESLQAYGIERADIQNITIDIRKESEGSLTWLLPVLSLLIPLIFLGAIFWIIVRQSKKAGGGGPGGPGAPSQIFKFLKAPAKLFGGEKGPKQRTTFDDIADLKEAKEEMKEVVDFLKNPNKYLKMGAEIPRGVLLVGPPGTGKTMLARAVANEASVPFFSIAGSEFIELFVGVGSSRVRNLFETAKKNSPALIFIDELDAIGKTRMPGIGGGHEEREQTLNQILSEMDGFERDTGVIVLGATNAPQYLDPALLRPGRFDRRIVLNLPDTNGREKILKIHTTNKPLSRGVDLREIAERTPGFSGADLANLANEAAILAAKKNKKKISQGDFLESIEKVLLGPERKSHLLSKKEKEISAYHETGHALVGYSLPETKEIRKISIIARGMAAGYTLSSPKEETKIKGKSEFLANMAMLLGGYCAEKLIFNEISTGASDDLEKATRMARSLVTRYGMSSLGPVTFGEKESLPYLGVEREGERNYSEKVAAKIDKETEKFIKEAEKTAISILKTKKDQLKKIAKVLIEKETIEKEEFEKLAGKKLPKKSPSKRKKAPRRKSKKNKKE